MLVLQYRLSNSSSMLNRVKLRIVKSGALFILSAMLYRWVVNRRVADTYAVSEVPQEGIPLASERISTTLLEVPPTASTARWLCTPTPYPPNVTVLGRVLEKCIPTSTSTSTPGGFAQDDIYVTVRTTQINHNTRLRLILCTWLQTLQPDQV